MAEIIRLNFDGPSPETTSGECLPLEVVGRAAGYIVGMVREVTEQGPMIRVIMGLEGGSRTEAVALIPDCPQRQEEAVSCAITALRTLEILYAGQWSKPD